MSVIRGRQCSRAGCANPAVATLTYVYADSTAVLGPLALAAEPHSYDLCATHADRLTAPRGWEVVRLEPDYVPLPPSDDDLMALAKAVRESAQTPSQKEAQPLRLSEGTRLGHLRVLDGGSELQD